MKVTRGIAVSVAMFVLTAAAIAEPSHTLDEAIHDVLLPGTKIVAGDNPKDNDFYIATEEDAVKIVENQKQAKANMQAAVGAKVFKVLAEKHAEEHKDIRIDPKLLATLNVDTKKVLNTYAAYESKATIANVNEKISTQAFQPVMVASADKEPGPQIEKQAVTDYPLEPVFSATPKKPVKKVVVADASKQSDLPEEASKVTKKAVLAISSKHEVKKASIVSGKKTKTMVADKSRHSGNKVTIAVAKKSIIASMSQHGVKKSSRTAVVASRVHSKRVHAGLKSVAHKSSSRKAMASYTAKGHKKLAAGVVKPYVPSKTVQRKRMLAVRQSSHRSHSVSSKYVVKTVSFDRNRRLKLVSLPKGQKAQKLSSNAGVKNRSRYQFKVIHLYR